MSLFTLYPSFLQTFMDDRYEYSVRWRYEFNKRKSGTVTFTGDKRTNCTQGQEPWITRSRIIGSSVSELNDNIETTRKKAEMDFSSSYYRLKVNPFIYVKFWKQAGIPSLLF